MRSNINKIKKLRMEDVPFIVSNGSEYHLEGNEKYKFYYHKKHKDIRYSNFSEHKSGDLIQFIIDTQGKSFKEAVDYLSSGITEELEQKLKERKVYKAPEIDLTAPENELFYIEQLVSGLRNDQALEKVKNTPISERFDFYINSITTEDNSKTREYLIKDRCINSNIVDYFISEGLIKTTNNLDGNNTLFIYKNPLEGDTSGLTMRGTRDASYRYDEKKEEYVKGRAFTRNYANTSYGFNIVKGTPKKLVILESPIDLLSYLTLFAGQEKLNDAIFMATGGTNRTIIDQLVKLLEDTLEEIVVATDNDKAGELTYDYVKETFDKELKVSRERSLSVDFNDDLKNINGKNM